MKRVFACGEGVHDVGRREWSIKSAKHVETDGWIQPIVRSMVSSDVDFVSRHHRDLPMLPNPKLNGLQGHARRAAMAKFVAKTEGCTAVIFAVDADTNETSDARSKEASILKGFEALNNGVEGVACVPQSASEAWLLADENAWQFKDDQRPPSFPDRISPERLWGLRDDPDSGHPKRVFERVCSESGEHSSRQIRVDLAEKTNLDVLASRCPTSYPPFEAAIRVALD